MTNSIRVVLVDDDPMVRTGLGFILGGDPAISVVAEAGDGESALAVCEEHCPDIVLMDIRMPRRDGLSATQELLGRPDPPKVVVLTTFDTDDMVVRALSLGASGFLLKDTPPARLVEAVRAVAAGDPMLSPSVTAQLIAAVTHPAADGAGRGAQTATGTGATATARLALLSDREREVAQAIGRGLSNAEIAAELYMSIATVKAHVGRIFTKLDLDNRVQIALLVHDAAPA